MTTTQALKRFLDSPIDPGAETAILQPQDLWLDLLDNPPAEDPDETRLLSLSTLWSY